MDIRRLSLVNFRNFAEMRDVEFPQGRLLVVAAPNATGKTNFLEALVLLLRGKSWRATPQECLAWNEKSFVVAGEVERGEGVSELTTGYDAEKKKMQAQEDGVPISPVVLYGRYPVVVFLPEDTFLLNRGPELRRNFLNSVLVSLPAYLAGLVHYHRTLRQRNAALKTARLFDEVKVWTSMMVERAETVRQQRKVLASFLEAHLAEVYFEMTQEDYDIKVRLKTDIEVDELFDQIKTDWERESRYGYTMWGPHKDDLEVMVGGRAAKLVLSQGQMRSLIIAMKVVSHNFIEKVTGEKPVVLLDEVLSELDEGRQDVLLNHLPNTQIVMTCTELPEVLKDRDDVSVLDVRQLNKVEA